MMDKNIKYTYKLIIDNENWKDYFDIPSGLLYLGEIYSITFIQKYCR